MPRRTPKKERGVFERVPNSGIWWIRYKVAGVEHREKVGRRSDAMKLYAIRKADILRGMKMPANVKDKGIKFKVIAQEAIEWYANHERKDLRNFKSRMALIVENNSRIRYLLAQEESRLREVIARRFPIHLPSFDIALNTGMRKQEQFSLEWSQVSLSSRRIHLTMTKNGSTREIPMNRTCQQSFEVLRALGPHGGRIFQSKYGKELNNPRKWFELALCSFAGIHELSVQSSSPRC